MPEIIYNIILVFSVGMLFFGFGFYSGFDVGQSTTNSDCIELMEKNSCLITGYEKGLYYSGNETLLNFSLLLGDLDKK